MNEPDHTAIQTIAKALADLLSKRGEMSERKRALERESTDIGNRIRELDKQIEAARVEMQRAWEVKDK